VTCINDAPVANAGTGSVVEDGSFTGILSASDIEGDALTFLLDTQATYGVVSLASTGGFTYTPAVDYAGLDSFSYHVYDGASSSNIATMTIMVTPVNDPPTTNNISRSMTGNVT
jgi:large repetitive protein